MNNNKYNSVVTGGVQGIGKAIVSRLLQRGDVVHVFDCLPPEERRVVELQQLGVHYHCVDVSSVESIQNGFTNLPQEIHVLVNNAGITKDTLAVRMRENDWDSVLEINLKGAFFCAQQALKRMMKQPLMQDAQVRGYIVNVASIVGLTGNAGQANYVASKAGLIGLTKTLAQEYGPRNILVNAVAPGFIKTAMTDKLSESVKQGVVERIALKRIGLPEEVAQVVAFLSCPQAQYVTGNVIDVSGGMH